MATLRIWNNNTSDLSIHTEGHSFEEAKLSVESMASINGFEIVGERSYYPARMTWNDLAEGVRKWAQSERAGVTVVRFELLNSHRIARYAGVIEVNRWDVES